MADEAVTMSVFLNFQNRLDKSLSKIDNHLKKLVTSVKNIERLTITPTLRLNDQVSSQISLIEGKLNDLDNKTIRFNLDYCYTNGGNYSPQSIKRLATGGIFAGPTLSWVGEAGPEAVIPLSPRFRSEAFNLWQQTGRALGIGTKVGASGTYVATNHAKRKPTVKSETLEQVAEATNKATDSSATLVEFIYNFSKEMGLTASPLEKMVKGIKAVGLGSRLVNIFNATPENRNRVIFREVGSLLIEEGISVLGGIIGGIYAEKIAGSKTRGLAGIPGIAVGRLVGSGVAIMLDDQIKNDMDKLYDQLFVDKPPESYYQVNRSSNGFDFTNVHSKFVPYDILTNPNVLINGFPGTNPIGIYRNPLFRGAVRGLPGDGLVINDLILPQANGAILSSPQRCLVGEAGPEAIIPLSPRMRNRGEALWQKAGSIMGLNPVNAGGVYQLAPAQSGGGLGGVNVSSSVNVNWNGAGIDEEALAYTIGRRIVSDLKAASQNRRPAIA